MSAIGLVVIQHVLFAGVRRDFQGLLRRDSWFERAAVPTLEGPHKGSSLGSSLFSPLFVELPHGGLGCASVNDLGCDVTSCAALVSMALIRLLMVCKLWLAPWFL